MQIYGPTHVHGAQPINAPHRTSAPQQSAPTDSSYGVDQLDISREADEMISIRETSASMADQVQQARAERIERIRAEIADGVYETDEKLNIALGQMLDEIG